MSNSQELEKIVGQLEDSPGHILGLNGWLLRNLPKEKREVFLKGFEKLIRVVYFPDHVSDKKSKQVREKYIQAVSQAVSYLTSDEFAYDLAVEEVPTDKNPIVRLKTMLEQQEKQHESEASDLKCKLDLAASKIQAGNLVSQHLQSANSIETERNVVLSRLQEHNRKYLAQNRCYEIRDRHPFSISGRFIDFNRRNGIDLLYAIIFRNMSRLEAPYATFQDILEKHFLAGEKERLRFRNRLARHEDYNVRILGGLTIGSFREFITYKNLISGNPKGEITEKVFRSGILDLPNTSIPVTKDGFTYNIDPASFSIPMFNIGLPILIRETAINDEVVPHKKNSLFYVTGISFN